VLEDTDCTRETLSQEFPEAVVSLVVELTNVKVPGLTREQQKAEDHLRLRHVSLDARLIKLVDRLDNLLELKDAPLVFVEKYHKETRHMLEAVFPDEFRTWDMPNCAHGKLVWDICNVLYGCPVVSREGNEMSDLPLD
jgi:hypothetical protein